MRTRVSVAMMLGLLLWVSPPPADAASCTGVCNPDVDECCKDDCSWESEQATCIPFNHGETCRRKKCTYLAGHGNTNGGTSPQCVRGTFNNEPEGTACIGSNPCAQGTCNNAGQCINQTPGTNPCEDGNDCTTNSCTASGTQGFTCSSTNTSAGSDCTISDPAVCKDYECDGNGVCVVSGNLSNTTVCGAFSSGDTCQVRTCSNGACTGPLQGSVTCAAEPCNNRSCKLSGGVAVCERTNKPQGTVCDTDPWDCSHQRCTSGGVCKAYKTTTLKECDPDPNTPSHCTLSYCAGDKTCRTDAAYLHSFPAGGGTAFGMWNVEDARTNNAGNRQFTNQFLCPASDTNACTSDRCTDEDACEPYGCEIGQACPVPPCGDVCDIVNDVCTCRFD